MENYAIYAYNAPGDVEFVYKSLKEDHVSRFFWSYRDDCDLRELNKMSWDQMDAEQIDCWKHAYRLLNFKKGDWILHINVPEYGMVTAGKIVGDYYYDNNLPAGQGDGRHCFKVENVFSFNRNDSLVHPYLSARLKLQRALWRVYCLPEFEKSMAMLLTTDYKEDTKNIFLIDDAKQILGELTSIIQKNNPGKKLEKFLANVFRQIPSVVQVEENGFGWGTDFGADLIVRYKEGIVSEFEDEKVLVVQVKSFEGDHWDTKAVEQLKTAIEKYDASMGIIMTTGKRTEALENAFNKLVEDLKLEQKHVSLYLLAGNEVTQFVLQHGMNVLLGNE